MTNIPSNSEIILAVRDGGRTGNVADRLGMLSRRPYIYRRLCRLEELGYLVRSERYTAMNDIYWTLPGSPYA